MVNCLSSSSFGNLYTRKRLALNTSELLTFSIVSILGAAKHRSRPITGQRKTLLMHRLRCCLTSFPTP